MLGDSAQGMASLAQMKSLQERVRLEFRSVDRIGADVRILARVRGTQMTGTEDV